jgi:hypothetical protein
MRNLRQVFNHKGAAWSLVGGLLLAGLLSGCGSGSKFVEVQVQVDTCPSGGPMRTLSEGGACRPTPQLQDPTNANLYNNAKNTATGLAITDSVHMCNAGTYMCQSSPGTKLCGGTYKPCKTLYTPDAPPNGLTGNCQCGCP